MIEHLVEELCCNVVVMLIAAPVLGLLLRGYRHSEAAKLHRRFILLSVVLALPFIIFGSQTWSSNDDLDYKLDIYTLGMPLTWIGVEARCFARRELSPNHQWWVIPLVDSLFILQWVVWGQLLALGIRHVLKVKLGTELTTEQERNLASLVILAVFVILLVSVASGLLLTGFALPW